MVKVKSPVEEILFVEESAGKRSSDAKTQPSSQFSLPLWQIINKVSHFRLFCVVGRFSSDISSGAKQDICLELLTSKSEDVEFALFQNS